MALYFAMQPDCVDCNSVMLRAVVALVFSTLNIYLDVFR